jgi:hypothetical protein
MIPLIVIGSVLILTLFLRAVFGPDSELDTKLRELENRFYEETTDEPTVGTYRLAFYRDGSVILTIRDTHKIQTFKYDINGKEVTHGISQNSGSSKENGPTTITMSQGFNSREWRRH